MDILIWSGAALALLGLAGLVWSIATVAGAKRAKLDDNEMRAVLQKALPRNLASLGLSVIGLMAVIVGVALA